MSLIYLKNYRLRQRNLEIEQTFDVWYKGSEKEKKWSNSADMRFNAGEN